MKILIICNDFPPLNSIGAQRPYSWFRHLHKFNIQPVIITKNWQENQNNENKIETEIHTEGKIVRTLSKNTATDLMLERYGPSRFTIIRKFFTFIYKEFSFLFFLFDKHSNLYYEAEKILKSENFNFIITTGEPFILFKYGYLLSKKYKIKWIADFRDGWFFNHALAQKRDTAHKISKWIELQFEKKYIKQAIFIITVDTYLHEKIKNLHNKNVEVIYNGIDEFVSFTDKELNGFSSNKILFTHTGTLTQGQRVEFFLEAIEQLDKEKKINQLDIEIRFIGIKEFNDQFNRIMNYGNIQKYLKTTLRVSRDAALKYNATSDFLLSFTEKNYQAIYAKVYDYIAVKKPILVCPGDDGLLNNFISKTNAGIIINTLDEMKLFIIQAIENKKQNYTPSRKELNYEYLSNFTREMQCKKLAEIIKKEDKNFSSYPPNK